MQLPQVMEQIGSSVVSDAEHWFMILGEMHTHHLPTVSGIVDTPPLLSFSPSLCSYDLIQLA